MYMLDNFKGKLVGFFLLRNMFKGYRIDCIVIVFLCFDSNINE